MQNLLSYFSHLDLRASLEWVIKRFPLPTLLIIILSGLWFYQANYEPPSGLSSEWLYRSIVTCIVTFFLSTWISLFLENTIQKKYTPLLTNILPLVFGALFYMSLYGIYDANIEIVTYIGLTLSGFIAFVFVAPFLQSYLWKTKEIDAHFYNYFILVSWVFLMSILVWLAVLLLGFTAIASVMALFDINSFVNEWKLYANWAIISLSLIAPLYGLIHLPIKSEYTKSIYTENRFFSFLVRYVATPFIYIYFIILYAYSFKVLSNFSDWPKGVISWMVIGFSSFGYLIYIFSRAYEWDSKIVSIFRRYFAYLVLPQVCMLFYAIYLRINQYDITMNRYFVVVFGLWLTIISLYYVISRARFLSFIPASLLIIILIISVGPWSVYSLPLTRQYDRLVRNLEKANILQNWAIVPLKTAKDISKELSNEIYSGIAYVCNFGDCKLIKELFKKEVEEATIKDKAEWEKYNTITGSTYAWIQKWTITNAVTEKIKVQSDYSYEAIDSQKYIQYNTSYQNDAPYPLSLGGGYTKIVRIYGWKDLPNKSNSPSITIDLDDTSNKSSYPYIVIDSDTAIVSYHRGSGDILPLAFSPPAELVNTTTPVWLEQSDLTFIAKGKWIEVKMLLQNYAIKNPAYTGKETYSYYNNSGIALVKETR